MRSCLQTDHFLDPLGHFGFETQSGRQLVEIVLLGGAVDLREAAYRVLRLPTVADKTFLITIGDRTVGGSSSLERRLVDIDAEIEVLRIRVNKGDTLNRALSVAMAMYTPDAA